MPDISDAVKRRVARGVRGYESLSAKERAVYALLVEGYSIKEVAHRVGVTYQTAKNHASAIYLKMDVRDRFALLLDYTGHPHLGGDADARTADYREGQAASEVPLSEGVKRNQRAHDPAARYLGRVSDPGEHPWTLHTRIEKARNAAERRERAGKPPTGPLKTPSTDEKDPT